MNSKSTWKILLLELGFTDKPVGLKASHWIMAKDEFEVEFSTGHLWENVRKKQKSIMTLTDLSLRYKTKTGKELEKYK